jgi:hypothetical protein
MEKIALILGNAQSFSQNPSISRYTPKQLEHFGGDGCAHAVGGVC